MKKKYKNLNDSFLDNNYYIFKKYKPLKKIGHGAFSNVYSVMRLKDKKIFAMKTEKITKRKMLESEAYYLFNIQGFGIPKFITYGHTKKYFILIESLLGKSLYDLFINENIKCYLSDVCLIGLQLLDRFEWIHSKHIIYRDVKPENFLIGINDPNVIYIIDFGLCKKFRSSKTGKHILPKLLGTITGTLRYASPNVVKGKESSRRDDLIALGYVLIHLIKKELPWDFFGGILNRTKYLELIYLKDTDGGGSLFKNLPHEFVEYFKYTKNLKFEQTPNYSYLRSLFNRILLNLNLDYNKLTFCWINPERKLKGFPKNHSLRNSQSLSHSRIYKNIIESSMKRVKSDLNDEIKKNNFNKIGINMHNNAFSNVEIIPKEAFKETNSLNVNNNISKLNSINILRKENYNNIIKKENKINEKNKKVFHNFENNNNSCNNTFNNNKKLIKKIKINNNFSNRKPNNINNNNLNKNILITNHNSNNERNSLINLKKHKIINNNKFKNIILPTNIMTNKNISSKQMKINSDNKNDKNKLRKINKNNLHPCNTTNIMSLENINIQLSDDIIYKSPMKYDNKKYNIKKDFKRNEKKRNQKYKQNTQLTNIIPKKYLEFSNSKYINNKKNSTENNDSKSLLFNNKYISLRHKNKMTISTQEPSYRKLIFNTYSKNSYKINNNKINHSKTKNCLSPTPLNYFFNNQTLYRSTNDNYLSPFSEHYSNSNQNFDNYLSQNEI